MTTRNEYQIRGYCGDLEITDSEYFFKRNEAITAAKHMLKRPDVTEVDLQVIYDCNTHDSELADVYWTITDKGITKH